MNYHTLDRFQGAWLGSAIATLIELQNKPENLGITDDWLTFLVDAEQIAKTAIESQRLSADALASLVVAKKLNSDRQNAPSIDREKLDQSSKYSNCLLSLLPLIIFYGDNWNLLQEIVKKYCLKSGNLFNNLDLEEDILIWSYFITSILNSEFEINDLNHAHFLERVLADVAAAKTALTTQLRIVIQAIKRGTSLQQLSEELLPLGNEGQTAIALSYYCFATTPFDFKLSVQRSAKLKPRLANLTTALTGTISGAYNGMARIPLDWRKMANKHSAYRSARVTVLELFKAWLGIDPAKLDGELNLEIQAIAVPRIIQPRKSLKIISQKSNS